MIKVVLPWPDSALLPNRKNGQHWASYQKQKANARALGFYSTRQQNVTLFVNTPAHLKIVFYAPDKRKRDLDNLLAAMKPSLDGIAKALNMDDSLFRPITIDLRHDQEKKGFVEVYLHADFRRIAD